jgi:nucleotide-binding universal stress UspA family protein
MLAGALPAELVLFRAVSLPTDVKAVLSDAEVDMKVPLEQLEVQAQDYLEEVAERLQQVGLKVQRVVRRGPAAEVIVDYADQMGIQQIVMATHGYSGISRWVHGSVAERVLQSAGVPVLLIPAQTKTQTASDQIMSCQRILVPLDGSLIAERVLPPVTSMAQALDAHIVLFRVPIVFASGALIGEWAMALEGAFGTAEQIAKAYLERVAGQLRARGIQVSTVMRTGAVADSVIEYAESNGIDLIAMCTHGRTGVARWALGSVADRVLRAGHVPILLVRTGS